MSNRVGLAQFIITIAVVLAVVIGIAWSVAIPFTTRATAVVQVTDKEPVIEGLDGDVSSKYLVFTKHQPSGTIEVFENTDVFLLVKFNSSDLQAELEVGSTCLIDVIGYRVPFLSWYRNIVSAECSR